MALFYQAPEFPVSSIRKRVQVDCKTDSECTRNSKNVIEKDKSLCVQRSIQMFTCASAFVLLENCILWQKSQILAFTKGSGPLPWKYKGPYPL